MHARKKGLYFPRYENQHERELGFDEIYRWEEDNSFAKRAGRAGMALVLMLRAQ